MNKDPAATESIQPFEASDSFYESLLKSAPDAIIVIQSDGLIAFVNHQAETMFGYTKVELVGSSIEILLPARLRSKHVDHRKTYAKSPAVRQMGQRQNLMGLRKNGDEFPVEISLSPVRTAEGAFTASVIRDVTERKKLESEIVKAQLEAERANKANSAFLAAASHDLRQPVQALTLLNGALRRTVKNESALAMIENQNDSLTAMTNLLNSLLDISRLDAGGIDPDIEDFPIADIVDRLAAEFSRQANQKGLKFTAASSSATVRSDSSLLAEIIQNLVSNGIRYTHEGCVTLSFHERRDQLMVKVCDTGIGIHEEDLVDIFNEFHQLNAPGSNQEGFGLGLAIVRRLVDLLGHELTVESEPGKGSCFCIDLPLISGRVSNAFSGEDSDVPQQDRIRSGLILLIEDDANVANALSLLLKAEEYTVAVAASKKEAMALVRSMESAPQLVVSDYHIQGATSGVDTITEIRQFFEKNIPAIVVSGDTSMLMDQAKKAGNSLLLRKPVDPDQLLAITARVVASGSVDDRPEQ